MYLELQTEKQLEDYLYQQAIEDGLCPITGHPVNGVYRQVDTGTYGIMDLVMVTHPVVNEETGEIVSPRITHIYELKKGDLDGAAFGQIARYKRCIDLYNESDLCGEVFSGVVKYFLVGSGINTASDICYLAGEAIPWLRVYTFRISIQHGIEFEEQYGWHKKNADFSKLLEFSDMACPCVSTEDKEAA